ncbi:efflux RND transporter periplasmic adaptor subunit [Pseudoalteromonas sp. R3]|uniref:efflux RND transporter periplasmic adaptor subunit n=1 Tax=Pseudoalteromonas sp. R3 TaxID=1709477 RepID=UPI0006B4C6C5|nr:efflux RND transporter periplasmic adaptor subunit [Pseudoalteromonas sp. R3]AZZ98156.1 efflux RND transporter periplasmic adaptor subunit [Pseudoalteromonas sp. R3]
MMFKARLPAIAAGATLLLSLVTVVLMTPVEPMPRVEQVVVPTVSVLTIERTELTPTLSVQAHTQARWPVQLKATSSARLAYLGTDMEPGKHVKKGQVLARLNTRLLESQLVEARSTLKQAELNLQQQLHEQEVAQSMRPAQSSTAFARMEPHLAAARAELARAQQNVKSAQQMLDDAIIVAPYDAMITQRFVSPGEWMEASQTLFELVASDSMDIHVPLSQHDWDRISTADLDKNVIKIHSRSGASWPASVRYVSPLVNETTRQRTLVLTVFDPYHHETQLLPNQQVKVQFELKNEGALYELPLSAVDPDELIWVVTAQQQLRQLNVRVIEVRANSVIVSLIDEQPASLQVVRFPLRSMMAKKKVNPVTEALQIADKQEAL